MAAIEPFVISVPEADLADLQTRLAMTRWPPSFETDGWKYGANTEHLRELVAYWIDGYDWRARERAMNAFNHFRTTLDGVPIHFVHERGKGPNAIPIILTHGYPWTFMDMTRLIPRLTDPVAFGGRSEDSFDVVVPSLPGFGFSTPLPRAGIAFAEVADLWVKLMQDVLGYNRFCAHGGDWGMIISSQLGHKHADKLIGIHLLQSLGLDFFESGGIMDLADYAPEEAYLVEKDKQLKAREIGYLDLLLNEPQTMAFSLADSPVGLCAWLVEKRRKWSDCEGDVERRYTKDELLDAVMLYWLNNTHTTATRIYIETRLNPWRPSHDRHPVVEAPTASIALRRDIFGLPRRWVERNYNLQRYTIHDHGGHFASFEEPDRVAEDIRAFFSGYR